MGFAMKSICFRKIEKAEMTNKIRYLYLVLFLFEMKENYTNIGLSDLPSIMAESASSMRSKSATRE